MHGVNTASRSARAIRVPAPQNPFSPGPASTPACSPQAFLPYGAECSLRPFTRPGRLRLSTPPPRGQSSRPATSHSATCVPAARSVLQLRYPGRFAPTRAASLPRARCHFLAACYRSSRRPLLPFGEFIPLGITARPIVQPVSPPAGLARSPLTPRSPLCRKTSKAADHRSWSATFPEACCSKSEAKRS